MSFGYNKDGYPLQGKTVFQGFNVDIEQKKGSKRYWVDENTGENGVTVMHYDYGYFRDTLGIDDDEVDVYLGPDEEAKNVYVVAQMKKPMFSEIDEQKVMLGFSSEREAKAAYLKQYNNPKFFGGIVTIPVEEFKDKLSRYRGSLIKSIFFISDLILNNKDKSAKIHLESSNTYMHDILKSLTPAERYALSRDPNVQPGRIRTQRASYVHDSSLGTTRVALPGEPPVVPVRRVEAPPSFNKATIVVPKRSYPVDKPMDQTAKEYFRR